VLTVDVFRVLMGNVPRVVGVARIERKERLTVAPNGFLNTRRNTLVVVFATCIEILCGKREREAERTCLTQDAVDVRVLVDDLIELVADGEKLRRVGLVVAFRLALDR